MLAVLQYFLMALGSIFLLLLLAGWLVWETNLWSVRTVAPMLFYSEQVVVPVNVLEQVPETIEGADNLPE